MRRAILKAIFALVWLLVLPSLTFSYLHRDYYVGQALNINQSTASKILEEMTSDEVTQLIGGPPGDYRFDPRPRFYYTFFRIDAILTKKSISPFDALHGGRGPGTVGDSGLRPVGADVE